MHAGFAQFAAFDQDAIDNRAWLAPTASSTMPVLAIGGEKSFGRTMAVVMRAAATDVTEGVIPGSGHWIMEENPQATVAMVRGSWTARRRPTPARPARAGGAKVEHACFDETPPRPGLHGRLLASPALAQTPAADAAAPPPAPVPAAG